MDERDKKEIQEIREKGLIAYIRFGKTISVDELEEIFINLLPSAKIEAEFIPKQSLEIRYKVTKRDIKERCEDE